MKSTSPHCACGDVDFIELIPRIADRIQLLHHTATLNLEKSLFVESSETQKIRIVEVSFSVADRAAYVYALEFVYELYIREITAQAGHEQLNDEFFRGGHGGECIDKHTLTQQIRLRFCLIDLLVQNDAPLLQSRMLSTVVHSEWNISKGHVDTISNYVAKLGFAFGQMPPEMTCWIMLIFMSLINVHLLYIWNSIPASKSNPASPHCYKTPT